MQRLYEIGYYNNTSDDFHYEQMYFQSEQEAKEKAIEMKAADDEIINIVLL